MAIKWWWGSTRRVVVVGLVLAVLVGGYSLFLGERLLLTTPRHAQEDEWVPRWEVDHLVTLAAQQRCSEMLEAERLLAARKYTEADERCLQQGKEVTDLRAQLDQVKRLQAEEREQRNILNKHVADSSPTAIVTVQQPSSSPALMVHTKEQDEVVVLLWDNSWGNPFYWGAGDVISTPNYAGFRIEKPKCSRKCTFTKDKTMVTIADALLFDMCWYGTDTEWRTRPPYVPERREGQPWYWFSYEQRYYFTMMAHHEYLELFDNKITYANDSLAQITFMCPWGSKTPADLRTPPPPKTKDKLVAYIASNCYSGGADKRTEYVEELMKYIPVASFGLCLHNADLPEGKGWHSSFGNMMDIKMRAIGEYKFFLAFENNDLVEDYVTEKLINALYAGTVPVYRGAPNIEDWLPESNSIIDAGELAPKQLADLLLKLNEDDEAYAKYFEWKEKPYRPHFQTVLDNCIFFAECRICNAIAEVRNTSTESPLTTTLIPKGQVDASSLEFNRVDTRVMLTDDYVMIPTSRSLELEDDYTLMAWINLNMINDGRIIDKATAGKIDGYGFDVRKAGDGKGVIRLCAGGGCFTGARRLSRGIWYHVSVTFKHCKQGIRFYINGRLDKMATPEEKTKNNSYPVHIGRPSQGYAAWRAVHKGGVFDGLIDDVAIFKRALTMQEIRKYRYRRLTGKEQDLVGYWSFNEGEAKTIHDASPNGNHGQIYGAPRWVPTVTKPVFEDTLVERM